VSKRSGLLVLLARPPRVYVGPNAWRALAGERGVLLGARRAAWVDVVEFDPRPNAGIRRLVDLRFAASRPWDVVGLSLSSADLAVRRNALLEDLVPGDVVLTEKGPRVHNGAAWVAAPLRTERRRFST
jgi:hypothetical protein